MNSRAFRRSAAAVAAFSASAIVLAGCAGGSGSTPSADPNEEITLTIATFNNFGYTDELLQEYMDENPNVTIVHNKAAESGDARANYFQKLGKEGLADIEAVEIDWFAEAMQYSDLLRRGARRRQGPLARLEGSSRDRPRRPSRRLRHRHRTAGHLLPRRPVRGRRPPDRPRTRSPRCSTATGSNFFDVADQYKAATGKPMIDSANSVLQGIVNQMEYTYDEPDGTVIATSNPEIEDAYNLVVERAIPNSAYSGQWSDDWNASMTNGEFAAMLCPGWMLGVISRQRARRHRLGRRQTSSRTAAATGAART